MGHFALRVGVGGPVGSGKTALVQRLCEAMRDKHNLAVVTNDIYTKEDQQFLVRAKALTPDRILGVETGGCPHTAIREDASMNIAAIPACVEHALDVEDDDIGNVAPALALGSAWHETQYSRLFRS